MHLAEQDINMELYTQVANSPDVNLLDLGFFWAIQSFNDVAPNHEEELIHMASMAYDNYPLRQTELYLANTYKVFSTRSY